MRYKKFFLRKNAAKDNRFNLRLRVLLFLFYVVFFVLMKCPSCTAANVAIPAMKMIGIMVSKYNVKGTPMNSSKQVALLAKV